MSREKALKGFQCPSCGAPLEVKDGAKTVKCVYCGTTIKIPKEPSPVVEAIPKPVIDRDAVVEQYAKEEREKTERTIALTAIMAGIILFCGKSAAYETLQPSCARGLYHVRAA